MKLTPSDLQHQTFGVKFRGYDCEEVRAFLNLVSEEYESLVAESLRQKNDASRLREKLADFEERERILKDTLLSAQKVAEEMKDNAKKEAELIIKEAELRAEVVIEQAGDRLRQIQAEVSEVKLMRGNLEDQLQLYINNLQKLLDFHKEEDSKEDRLSLFARLRRRDTA
ncbi:MAG: DivIVA domain-containing protein [Acidobacteriota bacterium]